MTQFAGCAGRICRQAHRGGFRRRRSARCLGFVTRCGAASAASLLIVLALASPAGATFSGRNGVLLLTSGGGSGSVGLENPFSNFRVRGAVRVGQAPPSARTAECAYPARLATVRPDGTHGKDIGQGDRGLFSPLGFRLALHDSGDPCWGYGSDTSGPDPSIGVYIARRNGEHRRSVSGDGIAGWLPDGRLVVWQSASHGTLRLFTDNGVPVMTVDASGAPEAKAAALSCSARVAAIRRTKSAYALDIYTRTNSTVNGRRSVRVIRRTVARNRYPLGNPSWTPDGRALMFDHQDGRGDSAPSSLWTVGVDGRGVHRLLDPQGAYDAGPIISPDGRRIVFLRSHGTGESLAAQSVVMNSDGSKAKVLFDYPDYYSVGNAVWSPDSASIAFNVDNKLLIINASTGSQRTASFEGDGLLDWQALPGERQVGCADRGSAPIPKTAPPVTGLG